MRIQPLNNSIYNQNISHKAYFNPNALFKELYDSSHKTRGLTRTARDFNRNLPNHELEIISCDKVLENPQNESYTIRNNVNMQIQKITVAKAKEFALFNILCNLLHLEESPFFADNLGHEKECFDILTGLKK